MTLRQPVTTADAGPTPRKRQPGVHRALRGTLFEALFTPTGLITRDAILTPPRADDPAGGYALPDRHEQRRMLLTMRDEMLAGRGASPESIAVAAFLARATCVRFARPVPAAAVADTLRVAASLQRDMRARRPNARPSSREHLLLDRLGWACIGPGQCDMVFEVQADALEHRAPYAGHRMAVAAATTCFEAACLHRALGQDPAAVIEHVGASLRGLLSLAACTVNLPPPHDPGMTGADAVPAPVRLLAREGEVVVTLDLLPEATATLRLPGQSTALSLNALAFRALSAAALCGDAEEASQARGISVHRAHDGDGMVIQAQAHAVRVSDWTFVALQNALLRLHAKPPYALWVRDLELTRGFA